MQAWLEAAAIKSKVILDSAVGYVRLPYEPSHIVCGCCRFIMEKIDLVIVGAEGVVESGGIVNKVRHNGCGYMGMSQAKHVESRRSC